MNEIIIYRIISFVLLIGFIIVSLSNCTLKNEIDGLNGDLNHTRLAYQDLEISVKLQNQQVELLEQKTKEAEDRFLNAISKIDEQNKKLNITIDSIKSLKGTSCEDAMKLVDIAIKE